MSAVLSIPQQHVNLEAEQALVGSLLVNNAGMLSLPRYFREEHFSHPMLGKIFSRIREYVAQGREANPITLKADFDEALKEVGGAGYLAKLAAQATGVFNLPSYCQVIQEAWQRRELCALCLEAMERLVTEETPNESASLLSVRAESIMADVVMSKAVTDYDVGCQILEDLKNEVKPFSTGLSTLDIAMGGGLFERKLYGFAARKKVGKTILAATLSYNLSQQGVKHLFVCAEMSAKEVQHRILARATDSFESAFRSDYGHSDSFQVKLAHTISSSKRCTFFEDKPGISFQELQQILPVYAVRHKIRGFILDYWQLVGGKPKNKSTAEHLDEVAQWLATFCRKYAVWGVVMAQINQDGNTRGSEGLRLAADQVYEIHREDLSSPCAWLEMMETRYTKWANIGSPEQAGLMMNEKGPYFEQ